MSLIELLAGVSAPCILHDSIVIAVVHLCPRAIPPTMIIMRKSIHGFHFLSYMGMGPFHDASHYVQKVTHICGDSVVIIKSGDNYLGSEDYMPSLIIHQMKLLTLFTFMNPLTQQQFPSCIP